jgi:thiosulfate dehydrogenase [quinone] large subunit
MADGPAVTKGQGAALILLRLLVGWHFLYEGLVKAILPAWSRAGQPIASWSAWGYIHSGSGPVAAFLEKMVAVPGAGPWIDRLVIAALILVGLSLLLGLFTQAGCWGALLLLALFYLVAIPTQGVAVPGAEGSYLLVNKNLVEAAAVLVLLVFRTGRIAGLDLLRQGGRS